jgi:hypothetical protein
MSYLRGKTQKAKKFGTPTTPAVSTPKAPSPKPTKTIRTVAPTVTTAPKAVSKPTTTRRVITQQEAGQIAQETFRTQVQSLTASLRSERTDVKDYLSGSLHPGTRKSNEEKLAGINEKIAQIETEQHEAVLAANINQIIQAIESGQVLAPDYFQNNIIWVKTGAITQQQFLDAYYHLSNQGIIHSAPTEPEVIEPVIEEIIEPVIEEVIEPVIEEVIAEPDPTITDNMVTQQVINFNIVNGRAVGSIKFVATNNFNPYYYGQDLVNIIQFKDPNGAYIKSITIPLKENRLNFTETERDEVINYSEDMYGNTRATVESFVWPSATIPRAFSKTYSIEISEAEPPKPLTTGFMSAGAAGAIAGLVLLGFIIDHKVSKR